jgi:hypothetical protein
LFLKFSRLGTWKAGVHIPEMPLKTRRAPFSRALTPVAA